jgi:FAD/FMN-containing dehydrogenase
LVCPLSSSNEQDLRWNSVPVSKLPDLVYDTKKDLAEFGLVSTIVGHVGDGNFHALILFKTDEEMAKAKQVIHRMVKRAISLDGTCKLLFFPYFSSSYC